jgi:hypothetical protein
VRILIETNRFTTSEFFTAFIEFEVNLIFIPCIVECYAFEETNANKIPMVAAIESKICSPFKPAVISFTSLSPETVYTFRFLGARKMDRKMCVVQLRTPVAFASSTALSTTSAVRGFNHFSSKNDLFVRSTYRQMMNSLRNVPTLSSLNIHFSLIQFPTSTKRTLLKLLMRPGSKDQVESLAKQSMRELLSESHRIEGMRRGSNLFFCSKEEFVKGQDLNLDDSKNMSSGLDLLYEIMDSVWRSYIDPLWQDKEEHIGNPAEDSENPAKDEEEKVVLADMQYSEFGGTLIILAHPLGDFNQKDLTMVTLVPLISMVMTI